MHSTINVTIQVREAFNNLEKHLLSLLYESKLRNDLDDNFEKRLELINNLIGKIHEVKISLWNEYL